MTDADHGCQKRRNYMRSGQTDTLSRIFVEQVYPIMLSTSWFLSDRTVISAWAGTGRQRGTALN